MSNAADANRAINALNGEPPKGRSLNVNEPGRAKQMAVRTGLQDPVTAAAGARAAGNRFAPGPRIAALQFHRRETMHYKLLGFSEKDSVRTFSFHRIGPLGTTPVAFKVLADMRLAREHKVPLQELPSLCSRLLEGTSESGPAGVLTLGAAELSLCAAGLNAERAAQVAAAQKRRAAQNRHAEEPLKPCEFVPQPI